MFREGDSHLSRVRLPMFGVINASLMSCKMVPVVSEFTPIDQNLLGLSYLHILILLGFFLWTPYPTKQLHRRKFELLPYKQGPSFFLSLKKVSIVS